MNLTLTDVKILVAASAMVVIMSFVFPALGMAGTEQTQSDIPEFNVTRDRFDFAGDLPQFPLHPTFGVLNHSSDRFDDFRGHQSIELGNGDNGNRTIIHTTATDTVNLTDLGAVDPKNEDFDSHVFTSDGEQTTLQGNGWTIEVHALDISRGSYEWEATKRPKDADLPLIGGLASYTDDLVSAAAWLASTFVVISQLIIQKVFNAGGVAVDVFGFSIDLSHWLLSTYFGIVDNAPGYAKVILTVPGLMIFYVFFKLMIVGIQTTKPLG